MFRTNTLKDKVAIITGASQGLGKQFASLVAANGAKVALAARQVPKLEELKNKLEECGSEVMVIEMDVLDQESIIQGVAKVESKWAIPDILIN